MHRPRPHEHTRPEPDEGTIATFRRRPVPLELARCDPHQLSRHEFEVVRRRALELGFVDLDAVNPV